MRDLSNATTVAELIELLQDMDPNRPVLFTYQYGDHARTVVADVANDVDEALVKWSDYHNSWKLVALEGDEVDEHEEGLIPAVVIQA